MLIHLLSATVERTLNTALKLSHTLADNLLSAQHRVLSITITDWSYNTSILFDGKNLHFIANNDSPADCAIACDTNTLLELQDPAKVTQLIRQGKLDLEGDLKLAQTYSSAFSSINIDWADKFSPILGDGLSYQIVSSIKKFTSDNNNSTKRERVIRELMQDELAVTIHPEEFSAFQKENRILSNSLAKLDLRINKLIEKHKAN